MSIKGVLGNQSVERKEDIKVWEGAGVVKSKYADELKQIGQTKIPASGWKCSQCEKVDNLWLCLTCGEISCGRKFFDGTGGNNHGVQHYQQHAHPLVVKLGTIVPSMEGEKHKADVYSYPEDDMVDDPHLEKHLLHFGINISEMKKTEKTMAELELDQNVNFDFSRIQESDKELVAMFGPGFTGLTNMGNTCYLASVMQVLMSIPEFVQRYRDEALNIYTSNNDVDTLNFQLTKLANGLLSGKYSKPLEVATSRNKETDTHTQSQIGIPPRTFKHLVGKGHPEFSTNRQQDALEFLQHLIQLIERESKLKGLEDASSVFKYKAEDRVQCSESLQVKYTHRLDNILSVPVPLEHAINKAEYEEYSKKVKLEEEEKRKQAEQLGFKKPEGNINDRIITDFNKEKAAVEKPVRPRVPMKACLEAVADPEEVDHFYSSAIKRKTQAIKTAKLATFPEYLIVQVRRFILDGWVPKKLDVFIENPEEIDISSLRGNGIQANETELPNEESDSSASSATQEIVINESIVSQLLDMGIPLNRARRGVWKTNNSNVDAAISWVFEHSEDADIDQPIEESVPQKSQGSDSSSVPEEAIENLCNMGFDRPKAIFALKQTDNNAERAVDWLFNHMDDIDQLMNAASAPSSGKSATKEEEFVSDGEGKYELLGFISHIGTNTNCGHYVCHIKKYNEETKQREWVLFNDRKVALSQEPPFDMGYIYLYRRKLD
jgi:ubiquitin carboxyl-terminal hydrolase 5/13